MEGALYAVNTECHQTLLIKWWITDWPLDEIQWGPRALKTDAPCALWLACTYAHTVGIMSVHIISLRNATGTTKNNYTTTLNAFVVGITSTQVDVRVHGTHQFWATNPNQNTAMDAGAVNVDLSVRLTSLTLTRVTFNSMHWLRKAG